MSEEHGLVLSCSAASFVRAVLVVRASVGLRAVAALEGPLTSLLPCSCVDLSLSFCRPNSTLSRFVRVWQATMVDVVAISSGAWEFVLAHPLFGAFAALFIVYQLYRLVSGLAAPKNLPPIEEGWIPWVGVALSFGKHPIDFATRMLHKVRHPSLALVVGVHGPPSLQRAVVSAYLRDISCQVGHVLMQCWFLDTRARHRSHHRDTKCCRPGALICVCSMVRSLRSRCSATV